MGGEAWNECKWLTPPTWPLYLTGTTRKHIDPETTAGRSERKQRIRKPKTPEQKKQEYERAKVRRAIERETDWRVKRALQQKLAGLIGTGTSGSPRR